MAKKAKRRSVPIDRFADYKKEYDIKWIMKTKKFALTHLDKTYELCDTKNKSIVAIDELIAGGQLQKTEAKKEVIPKAEAPKVAPPKLELPDLGSGSVKEEPVKAATQSKIEEMLGSISSIKEGLSDGAAAIDFNIKNTKTGEVLDSRYEVHPKTGRPTFISQLPLTFRQRDAKYNVPNAGKHLNRGWEVVSKTRHKELFKELGIEIQPLLDYTPEGEFYSVGENVLCMALKSEYQERQIQKEIRSYTTQKQERDARQDFGKRVNPTLGEKGNEVLLSQNIQDDSTHGTGVDGKIEEIRKAVMNNEY